jgi:hypothetical protein
VSKKSSKPTPAGVGQAQPKGKVTFPRAKASELQEARNHLIYFKEL